MSRIFDQHGNYLGDASSSNYSLGASIWEFFHPAAVQQEAVDVGAPVPSTVDVLATAGYDAGAAVGSPFDPTSGFYTSIGSGLSDVGSTVAAGASDIGSGIATVASGTFDVAQLAVYGLIAFAVLELLGTTKRAGESLKRVHSDMRRSVTREARRYKRRQ